MARKHAYDLLIIGGGLAGSALGRVMALAGHEVLIIEKTSGFRDRIRGEVLLPWGGVEAMELGIRDLLLKSCGRELMREYFVRDGVGGPPRELAATTPRGNGIVSFYHPEMQACLLAEAERAGCEVWRGASLSALSPGSPPVATVSAAEGASDITARLVVGADGRDSHMASLLGFLRHRDPPELYTGGLQLEGDIPAEPALHFFQNGHSGRGAILVPNRPGNYRAYVFHHVHALERRWSGERDFDKARDHFIGVGVPRDWVAELRPHGVHATFDGAHQWISNPARDGCVLVGDAAASSDPVWGCGLSRTLRDVRLLQARLLADGDWPRAAAAYAADHDDAFHRLRRIEHFNTTLFFTMGERGEAIRQRAFAYMREHPGSGPDLAGLGPDSRCDDDTERDILGFVQWPGREAPRVLQ